MIKRPFFALLGLGAGLMLGVWAVRKVEHVRARLAPEELARSASTRAGTVGRRLTDALDEGRAAAAAREEELRAAYGVSSAEEVRD